MKLGIDLGNGYVKFNGKKFASKVKLGRLANFGEKRKDVYQVIYNDTYYIVGDGEVFTTSDRYFTEDYKVCLLTAIAVNFENNCDKLMNVNICTGLPVDKFMSDMRDKVKNHISNFGVEKIIVNDKTYVIDIKNNLVFVEGAYVVKTKDKSNIITIDIGAGTVNIIQWENQTPVKFDTKNKSFYNLYEKIAKHIKETNRGDVSTEYIEKNLGKDVFVIDQKEVNVKDTHKIIEKHIINLASQINNYFDVPQAKEIDLIGGGAIPTFEYWNKIYNGVKLIEDSQYINSEIFDIVAQSIKEKGDDVKNEQK
jgi:plasmid segregation protein ParM